uniref:Disease resistance-responsive family protein n=1 Tax=Rhizophora mucronata TaxID=61149 RepID=A0A2P2J8F7_RHIMU
MEMTTVLTWREENGDKAILGRLTASARGPLLGKFCQVVKR